MKHFAKVIFHLEAASAAFDQLLAQFEEANLDSELLDQLHAAKANLDSIPETLDEIALPKSVS